MLKCKSCGKEGEPDKKEVTFRNNTVHIEARCAFCGKFIKYLPQNEPWDSFIHFGKYKYQTLGKIATEDPEYLVWLRGETTNARLKERIDEVLESVFQHKVFPN